MKRDEELEELIDQAHIAFEETHEFPWMATDQDREDWVEGWLMAKPRYIELMEGGEA